ncbi:MAG: hypothetical protein HY774_22845 [Acidobacteria bacterium]|nr:hypothetical protein [Acidobacteriota bacterium]
MRFIRRMVWGWCLVLVLSGSTVLLAEKPTSPEKKAKMIALINRMESNPYHSDSKKMASEVFSWLADAPDVTVTVCTDVLAAEKNDLDSDESTFLFGHFIFSQARFIVEHPDQASDPVAVNRAGVDGILKAYATMKAGKPKLKVKFADQLFSLRETGGLDRFLEQALAKCK